MNANLKLINPDDAYVTAPYLAQAAGITYRQMDYWTRTGLLESLAVDRSGSGHPRIYSPEQVKRATAVRALLEAGMRLEVVRTIIDELMVVGELTRGPVTININEEEQ